MCQVGARLYGGCLGERRGCVYLSGTPLFFRAAGNTPEWRNEELPRRFTYRGKKDTRTQGSYRHPVEALITGLSPLTIERIRAWVVVRALQATVQ